MIYLLGFGCYLAIGLGALIVFDIATKRISDRISGATVDAQESLIMARIAVGHRMAMILLLGAMWLFWPAVFVGAITKSKEDAEWDEEIEKDENG